MKIHIKSKLLFLYQLKKIFVIIDGIITLGIVYWANFTFLPMVSLHWDLYYIHICERDWGARVAKGEVVEISRENESIFVLRT